MPVRIRRVWRSRYHHPRYTPYSSGGNSGVLDQTLGALTLVSAGDVDVAGVSTPTLAALTSSATGAVDVVGSEASTLAALTLSSTAAVDIVGTLAKTLDALTLSATGTVETPAINGTLTATLGALILGTPTDGWYWNGGAETGDAPAEGSSGNSEWQQDSGGGRYSSGVASIELSTEQKHSGALSWKLTIETPNSPTSGMRLFRWEESYANREAWYSVWIYIPEAFTMTANPATGRYWNMFQFKSIQGANNDPMFYFGPYPYGGVNRMNAYWSNSSGLIAGPYEGDDQSGKSYDQTTVTTIPIAQWVHLQAYFYQCSADATTHIENYDGIVKFWQDGVLIFDFENVRTSYYNTSQSAWNTLAQWAVNLYSDGLDPNPFSIYFDDAVIADRLQPEANAATGDVDVAGTLAKTLGALTISSAGDVDVAGTAAPTLDALTVASSGDVDITGALAKTLDALTSASAGDVDVVGSLSVTLDALTVVGEYTVGSPPILGELDQALAALSLSAAGDVDVNGTSAFTLDTLITSSAGDVDVAGAVIQTLGALTSSAVGTVTVNGQAANTLAALILTGTGTVEVQGIGTSTLAALAISSSAAVQVSGALAQTLAALTLSATYEISEIPELFGNLDVTLGALYLNAFATPNVGEVTFTATALAPSMSVDISVPGMSIEASVPSMNIEASMPTLTAQAKHPSLVVST